MVGAPLAIWSVEDKATLILCPVLPTVRAGLLRFKVPVLLMEVERKCRRSGPQNCLVVSAKVHNWEVLSA